MCNLNGHMGFATEKKFGKIWHDFPNEKFLSGACDDSSSYKGTSKVKNANIFFNWKINMIYT